MSSDKKVLSQKILDNLQKAADIRKEYGASKELTDVKNELKGYQVERLKFTHAEFLENPETKDATHFFLTEIYSEKDLTKRDKGLEKVVPMMCKLFTPELLLVLSDALELDALTEELDMTMSKGLKKGFTSDEYIKMYQTTDFNKRKRQIELTEKLGDSLKEIIKFPLIGTLLGTMGGPAKLMGLKDVHMLLQNGFNIFSKTKDVDTFLKTLIRKEYEILDSIYNTVEA